MINRRELFLKYLAQTSDSPLRLEIEKAEGVYLFDAMGKPYFDLISGISVSNIGHNHPAVVRAVCEQASRYMHLMVYGEYIQSPQVELAQKITNLLPRELNSVYFVNSGSEAVEGALKLAKRFTGRYEVVAFRNAYHGSTHGSLSLMSCEAQKQPFYPLLPMVRHVDFNSIDGLEIIGCHTACVIIEPIQAEAGIRLPTTDFLVKLRQKCTKEGALLIFDEIQTGMGRTGNLFAFQKYGVQPDILLLAKAFGGGMPLGAFISTKDIMQHLSYNPPLGHITTFGGHPVSCAAAIASLNFILENRLVESVKEKEKIFEQLLSGHNAVKEFRSAGLLIAIELGDFEKVQKCISFCLKEGIITDWFLFCNTAIRIAPPLTISPDQIRDVCSILLRAFDRL